MSNLLDEILGRFNALPQDQQEELKKLVAEATADWEWVENAGPQKEAVETLADELFYGGQAGGGKTDLLCGLALTAHKRSLILRRINQEVRGIEDRLADILDTRDGLNASNHVWRRPGGRTIEMGGCQYENDKQRYKGNPHDLIGFDEIADFSETQYRFITTWNRSADPNQRCRVVCTGNPPTTPEGLWVLKYWAPWLDENHPNPAQDGELRYYTTIGGEDFECDGPEPVEVDGEFITPRSRTFIRSRLSDNPDLNATNYDAVLAALPEELRDAYREGKFTASQKDAPQQVIPTEWIKAAMARWDAKPPAGIGMSCLSHDVALGGGDSNAFARRHGHWYDQIIVEKLKGFVDPIDLASRDITLMRDGCPVVIDMGGGFGSGVYSHLKQNVQGITLYGHDGSGESRKRSRDGKFGFANKRAEVWWKFREALEPNLGEPVALPPDPELLADLAAPRWKLTSRGFLIEEKVAIKKRLGRSPDKGDAVVNGWAYGEDAVTARIRVARNPTGAPRVNLGYTSQKVRRAR